MAGVLGSENANHLFFLTLQHCGHLQSNGMCEQAVAENGETVGRNYGKR